MQTRRSLVERQIAGDDRRAALVALAEDLEEQIAPSWRQRHVAQFVDDQGLVAGALPLEAEQAFLVPGLDQFVDDGSGGGGAHPPPPPAGRHPPAPPRLPLPPPTNTDRDPRPP